MDPTTQAFVTEIVSRKIAENWLYWLLYLAAVFVAAYVSPYIKRRAENLATRDDFEELKRQLQQTTRLTEEIKAEIGHAEWKAREVNSLKRSKVEELLRDVLAGEEKASLLFRRSVLGDVGEVDNSNVDAAAAVASLYFENLRIPVYAFAHHIYTMSGAAIEIGAKIASAIAAQNIAEVERLSELGKTQYRENYLTLIGLKGDVEYAARAEMEALLAIEY